MIKPIAAILALSVLMLIAYGCELINTGVSGAVTGFCLLEPEQQALVEQWLDGQGSAVVTGLSDGLADKLSDSGLSPTTMAVVMAALGSFGLDFDLAAFCSPQDMGSGRLGPPGIEIVAD